MTGSKSIAQRVEEAIAPILRSDGFDLVCVEHVVRGGILRLYIDRLPAAQVEAADNVVGDVPSDAEVRDLRHGVTLDDCATVSRRVGDLLDAEGVLEGPQGLDGQYTLEVSSPGLDRPLVRPEHFQRFVGHPVTVVSKLALTSLGRRKVQGKLTAADAAGIRVEADGETFAIAYQGIERARLVPEFSRV